MSSLLHKLSTAHEHIAMILLLAIVSACSSSPTEPPPKCELVNPPSLDFSFVPPIGSNDQVKGVVFFQKTPCDTQNFRIALYVSFNGVGGICKSFENAPLTTITQKGTWENYYDTGGVDEQAPWIIALLVTKDFTDNCFTNSIPQVDGVKVLARVNRHRAR